MGQPVHLTPAERVVLKAKIDGLICVLFGLKAQDVEVILSSFETLHRLEIRKFERRSRASTSGLP